MGQLKATTSLGYQVTFEKVLYIPTLRRNLISMTRLLLGGYRIEAEGREVKIFRSGTLVMLGEVTQNLIILKFNVIVTESERVNVVSALTERIIEDIRDRWHYRLGHTSLSISTV